MSFSRSLSAAEQHTLISTANAAVVRIVSLFTAKLGNKHFFSREDIEDIAGDVIMKAWRSMDGYDPERAKMSTWVGRIAVNCVKDAVDYKMKRLPISGAMYVTVKEDGARDVRRLEVGLLDLLERGVVLLEEELLLVGVDPAVGLGVEVHEVEAEEFAKLGAALPDGTREKDGLPCAGRADDGHDNLRDVEKLPRKAHVAVGAGHVGALAAVGVDGEAVAREVDGEEALLLVLAQHGVAELQRGGGDGEDVVDVRDRAAEGAHEGFADDWR